MRASAVGNYPSAIIRRPDGRPRAGRLIFRPVNCYRLRHSYSVRLLLACGNKEIVQKALGHAKISTTDIYTTMIVDPRLQDAVKRAFG